MKHFSCDAAVTAQANVAISGSASHDFPEQKIHLGKLIGVPFEFIPGVVVTPVIDLYTVINGSVKAGFSVASVITTTPEVRISRDNGTWTTSKSLKTSLSIVPTLDLNASLECDIVPARCELTMLIDGVVGPYVSVDTPTIKGVLKTISSPLGLEFTASAGYDAEVGVHASILGKDLLDADFSIQLQEQRQFYDKTFPLNANTGAPSLAKLFSYTTVVEDAYGNGFDTNGSPIAIADQGNGIYNVYSVNGTKTLTIPSQYAILEQSAFSPVGIEGDYAYFMVSSNATGANGLLMMKIADGTFYFRPGATAVAADGDRFVLAETDSSGAVHYTLGSSLSGSLISIPLPKNEAVLQLAGNYLLLTNNAASRGVAKLRMTTSSRPPLIRHKARSDGDTYSLYTVAGLKITDYQGLPNYVVGEVNAINSNGDAVGNLDGDDDYGAKWDKSGRASLLSDSEGFEPDAITDDGLIVGTAFTGGSTSSSDNRVRYAYRGTTRYSLDIGLNGEYVGISLNGRGLVTDGSETIDPFNQTITTYLVN